MLVRIPADGWIILVRIPAHRWIILVRILPAQVDHVGGNTWIMIVGNDTQAFSLQSRVGLQLRELVSVECLQHP